MVLWVDRPLALIEFPADDPDRARRFWTDLLGVEPAERSEADGRGWQTHTGDPAVGIHERGTGPGDTVSLPYFTIVRARSRLRALVALSGESDCAASSGGADHAIPALLIRSCVYIEDVGGCNRPRSRQSVRITPRGLTCTVAEPLP
jgi:hypothetical protein